MVQIVTFVVASLFGFLPIVIGVAIALCRRKGSSAVVVMMIAHFAQLIWLGLVVGTVLPNVLYEDGRINIGVYFFAWVLGILIGKLFEIDSAYEAPHQREERVDEPSGSSARSLSDDLTDPLNPANPASLLSPANPANPASPLNPLNMPK